MSKKLDEEYKSMVAAEVPDLWDRIEKSLPEKAPAAEVKTSEAPDCKDSSLGGRNCGSGTDSADPASCCFLW